MKIISILIRILFGALLVFGAVAYFFHLFPEPVLTGALKTFNEGMAAAMYLMPLVKALELLCGISFLWNRYTALSSIVILPISINIVLVHVFLDLKNLPVAVFVILANVFLLYRNWNHYKGIFTP